MRVFWKFLRCHALAAVSLTTGIEAAGPADRFAGPDLGVVGKPYRLSLPPGSNKVKWGDGQVEDHDGPVAEHVYQKPGVVEIRVSRDGRPVPREVWNVPERKQPVFMLDIAGKTTVPGPVEHLPPAIALEMGGIVELGDSGVDSCDSFGLEAWVKWDSASDHGWFFSSKSGSARRFRLGWKRGKLVFELSGSPQFESATGKSLSDGRWHHVAVNFDRAPLFPRSNRVWFYIDGMPAGEGRIDAADPGAVPCASMRLGGDGFKGAIGALRIHDDLLFPAAIRNRADAVGSGEFLLATIADGGAEPVVVREPSIVRTVEVPLDSSPSADNGPVLREAISKAENGTRLRIVNRTRGAGPSVYPIRSMIEAPKWASLLIEAKKDFELDGNGAVFMMSDKFARFLWVKGCERVSIRNLGFDIDPEYARVGMYAKILGTEPATGTVKAVIVDGRTGKPVKSLPRRASYWRWRPHDAGSLRIVETGPKFDAGSYVSKPQADPSSGPGAIRFKLKQRPDDAFWEKLDAYKAAGGFYLINNADFSSNGVSLDECSHVTFERVNYHAVLGMVFLSADFDHLRIAGCRIGPPAGLTAADRPLVAGSDGYHFHQTRGGIVFENNEIALTDDDPVSFKDSMWSDIKRIAPRRLRTGKGIKVGHPVELLSPDFLNSGFKATVTHVDGEEITLDRDLPESIAPGSVLMDRSHHTRDWIIRNNHFHDYYGRVMLYTDFGTFIGNRVHNSYYHLGISDAYFERAGVSGRVITHGNLFEATVADATFWGKNPPHPCFHGITYSANSFLGEGIKLFHTQSALVARNWLQPGMNGTPPWISIAKSRGAVVSHNLAVIPGKEAFPVKVSECDSLRDESNLVLESLEEGHDN